MGERFCQSAEPGNSQREAPVSAALAEARAAMIATGQWNPAQPMGRRFAVGCVALEITQRCNLDCGACYLSEHSEAVKDLPLGEIFRRIDMIRARYGPHTDVQVTGGDPTLRKRGELIAIVARITAAGMRAALMTNGIRATRGLLSDLAAAGLLDVVFHVDVTQGRRGYGTEAELNALRRDYIARARGLGIAVLFNTTVFPGNLDQIHKVVAFFVAHSDVVSFASFQPVAETGRGVLAPGPARVTTRAVIAAIARGAGTSISFDTAQAGHARCNRYGMVAVANGRAYDLLDNPPLYEKILAAMDGLEFDRRDPKAAVRTFLRGLAANPSVVWQGAGWVLRKLWRMRADLIAARGRIGKLSFFIHNFMDACALDPERIKACVFMAATQYGPVSMCLHNARRDATILKPVRIAGEGYWDPLSGRVLTSPRAASLENLARARRASTPAPPVMPEKVAPP